MIMMPYALSLRASESALAGLSHLSLRHDPWSRRERIRGQCLHHRSHKYFIRLLRYALPRIIRAVMNPNTTRPSASAMKMRACEPSSGFSLIARHGGGSHMADCITCTQSIRRRKRSMLPITTQGSAEDEVAAAAWFACGFTSPL